MKKGRNKMYCRVKPSDSDPKIDLSIWEKIKIMFVWKTSNGNNINKSKPMVIVIEEAKASMNLKTNEKECRAR
jgi:hypothetical protein